MDKKAIRFVLTVQCENARKRCSGFACTNSFFERKCFFEGYPRDIPYIAVTCGGCDNPENMTTVDHFTRKLSKKTDIKPNEVAVHLSSCIVTENHHHDRCPHADSMKAILKQKGYTNIIEGTYISPISEKKRNNGVYKRYSQ